MESWKAYITDLPKPSDFSMRSYQVISGPSQLIPALPGAQGLRFWHFFRRPRWPRWLRHAPRATWATWGRWSCRSWRSRGRFPWRFGHTWWRFGRRCTEELDGDGWSPVEWQWVILDLGTLGTGPRGTSFKCLVAGKLQLRLFNRPMLNAPCESAKTNKCNIPYYRNMLQLTSNFKPSRCCLKKSGHAHHVQKKNTSTWHVEAKRTALLPFLKLALAKE